MEMAAEETYPRTDEELWGSLLQNPNRAWPEFWSRVERTVQARISRFRLSPEDSADVLQDLSLRLAKDDFKVLRNWDPTRCSLEGYVGVVANSTCLDFVRSGFHAYSIRKDNPRQNESQTMDLIELFQDEDPDPAERLHRLQVEEITTNCLHDWEQSGDLKPDDRKLLECRFLGIDFRQISQILGIEEKAAIKRFSRLKARLRQRLERCGVTDNELGG